MNLHVQVQADGSLAEQAVLDATTPGHVQLCQALLTERQLSPTSALEHLVFTCEFHGDQVSTAFLQLPHAPATVPSSVVMAADPSVSPAVAYAARPIDPVAEEAALSRKFPAHLVPGRTSGQAVVVARVRSDGWLVPLRLLESTDEQLGRACFEHVREVRWVPAHDQHGQPVATEIRYRCRLIIRRLPYTTI